MNYIVYLIKVHEACVSLFSYTSKFGKERLVSCKVNPFPSPALVASM